MPHVMDIIEELKLQHLLDREADITTLKLLDRAAATIAELRNEINDLHATEHLRESELRYPDL